MSINQTIENALSDIVPEIWPLSCPEEIKPEEYITYKTNEEPALFADDKDVEWAYLVTIHYFTKHNYIKTKNQIRKKLRDDGFMITEIEALHENDTGYYHVILYCKKEEE